MSTKREFTIHLKQTATGKTAAITVTEAAKPFVPVYTFYAHVPDTETLFAPGGQKRTLSIVSQRTTETGDTETVGYTIAVTGTAADLVTAERGGGSSALVLTTKPATSYDDTTATVTLTQNGSGKKVTITVTIAGKADDGVFTASPATLTFAPEGGTKTSTITSTSKGKTVGWTVKNKSSLPSWLTVSGEGTGTLSVTAKPNE